MQQLRRMELTLSKTLLSSASICFAFATLAAPAVVQGQNPPFSLSISGPKNIVATGGACDVSVTLTNVSDKPIRVKVTNGQEGAYRDFTVQVLSEPSGTMLKPIPLNSRPNYSQYSSFRFKTFQPNEQIARTLHVCDLFDLYARGTYQVQVLREIPKELGTGTVKSNAIEITKAP